MTGRSGKRPTWSWWAGGCSKLWLCWKAVVWPGNGKVEAVSGHCLGKRGGNGPDERSGPTVARLWKAARQWPGCGNVVKGGPAAGQWRRLRVCLSVLAKVCWSVVGECALESVCGGVCQCKSTGRVFKTETDIPASSPVSASPGSKKSPRRIFQPPAR